MIENFSKNQPPALPVTVYSPESDVRTPVHLVRAMFRDAYGSRDLAWRLFTRDLSAQYRQSLLGVIWAFVPPIMTSLIFIMLQKRQVISFGETDIPYPVYVLVGTIIWQVFTESLNAPLKATNLSKSILSKINFPHEAIIMSSVYNVLFNMLIKLIIIVAVLVLFRMPFAPGMLLGPFAMLSLVLLGTGIGFILTPLGMLYNDVTSGLPVVTQLWFLITPVVYSVPRDQISSVLMLLNPVTPLLVGTRDLFTTGYMTNVVPFTVVTLVSLVLNFLAWLFYRISIPIIVERVSS
jgi:lipopolysaccharide transport system permease protein